MHETRVRRHGDPGPAERLDPHRPLRPLAERFWEKVDKSAGLDPWPWRGATRRDRYGQINVAGRMERSHRIAWALVNGPVPGGMSVCHTCDNPPCCNPSHLFVDTHKGNMLDASVKGRLGVAKGEDNANHRLTAREVEALRGLWRFHEGESQRGLARRFGVGRGTVQQIIHYKIWKPDPLHRYRPYS